MYSAVGFSGSFSTIDRSIQGETLNGVENILQW